MSHPIRFGTDGWRATIAKEFTFANAQVVVQAIAEYVIEQDMREQGIVIGYDTRFLADEFAKMAAEVMAGNGIAVYLVEQPTPTPVIAHAVTQHGTAGAVMFTASHNPAHDMGMKYIPDYAGPANTTITKRLEALITDIFQSGVVREASFAHAESEGRIRYIQPEIAYLNHLQELVDMDAIAARGLRVVVDPMHGAGMGYVDNVLKTANCKVLTLHNWRDPLFGGSMPEPNVEHLRDLMGTVRMQKADLGLANDGDADRFGVVDEKGTYIPPNLVLALLLRHLVVHRKLNGVVVRTVATTHLLDRIAERYGLSVVETPVGFKYIGEQMLSADVLIGGEESGGLSIKGHLPEKDGILADLLIAELCAVEGKPLSEIVENLYTEYGRTYSVRLDLRTSEERKLELLRELGAQPPAQIAGLQVVETRTTDGYKFLLEDGSWVLVRPSGTEPLLRVYLESEIESHLQELGDAMQAYVEGSITFVSHVK